MTQKNLVSLKSFTLNNQKNNNNSFLFKNDNQSDLDISQVKPTLNLLNLNNIKSIKPSLRNGFRTKSARTRNLKNNLSNKFLKSTQTNNDNYSIYQNNVINNILLTNLDKFQTSDSSILQNNNNIFQKFILNSNQEKISQMKRQNKKKMHISFKLNNKKDDIKFPLLNNSYSTNNINNNNNNNNNNNIFIKDSNGEKSDGEMIKYINRQKSALAKERKEKNNNVTFSDQVSIKHLPNFGKVINEEQEFFDENNENVISDINEEDEKTIIDINENNNNNINNNNNNNIENKNNRQIDVNVNKKNDSKILDSSEFDEGEIIFSLQNIRTNSNKSDKIRESSKSLILNNMKKFKSQKILNMDSSSSSKLNNNNNKNKDKKSKSLKKNFSQNFILKNTRSQYIEDKPVKILKNSMSSNSIKKKPGDFHMGLKKQLDQINEKVLSDAEEEEENSNINSFHSEVSKNNTLNNNEEKVTLESFNSKNSNQNNGAKQNINKYNLRGTFKHLTTSRIISSKILEKIEKEIKEKLDKNNNINTKTKINFINKTFDYLYLEKCGFTEDNEKRIVLNIQKKIVSESKRKKYKIEFYFPSLKNKNRVEYTKFFIKYFINYLKILKLKKFTYNYFFRDLIFTNYFQINIHEIIFEQNYLIEKYSFHNNNNNIKNPNSTIDSKSTDIISNSSKIPKRRNRKIRTLCSRTQTKTKTIKINNTFKLINLINIQLDNFNLYYLRKFLFIEFKKIIDSLKSNNEIKILILPKNSLSSIKKVDSLNNNNMSNNSLNNNNVNHHSSNNSINTINMKKDKEKIPLISNKPSRRKSKYLKLTNSESASKIIESNALKNFLSEKLADTKFFIRNRSSLKFNKISKNYYISNKKKKVMSQEKFLEKQDKLNNFGFFSKNQMISSVNDIKHLLLKTMNNSEKVIFLIKDRNYAGFKNLFENQNINVETKDDKNNSLLNLAVQSNNIDIVKFLLIKGATPNTSNIFQNTPLHYALSYHNYQIADLLIEAGADEKTTNRFGVTPWQCIESINSVI